jgi:hypothetical protein
LKPEISISPSPDKWSIRAGGAVLGETMEALELNEGDNKPVLYFPKKAEFVFSISEETILVFLQYTTGRLFSSLANKPCFLFPGLL